MKTKIHLHSFKNHSYGERDCWKHRPTGLLVLKVSIKHYMLIFPKEINKITPGMEEYYSFRNLRNARTIIRKYWEEFGSLNQSA